MKKQMTWLIITILILIIAILSVLNVETVPVNFGFTVAYWPLILVILGSLFIGTLITGLLAMSRDYRYNKKVKDLEARLDNSSAAQEEQIEKTKSEYQEKVEELNQEINDKNQTIRQLERKLANIQSTSHR